MKKSYLFLLALLMLHFSGYTQQNPIAIPKDQIVNKKGFSKRDSIFNELNIIMNSCTGLPDNSQTWTLVKRKIIQLLLYEWIYDGVLRGLKAEEAFFVNVGTQTMNQNDITQGKLIVVVGVAMIKPAEFEIIRLEKQL